MINKNIYKQRGVHIIYYFHMTHIKEKRRKKRHEMRLEGSENSDKIIHHDDFEAWLLRICEEASLQLCINIKNIIITS